MNTLHLSHTNIRTDSRILKEMHSIREISSLYSVRGIGIMSSENKYEYESMNKLNIELIKIKSKEARFLPKIRALLIFLETLFKICYKALPLKPDIIHCHDNIVLPLGVIVKFFTGAKLIYDAHELESDKNGITKFLSRLTLFLEKILWKHVDRLIVVSPSIDKWYKDNIGEKDSTIIMNSPKIKKLEDVYNKEYLRDKFSIPKESKIFLYIGILGNGRGIDEILESFKKDDINSHIVFLGYGELKNHLINMSKIYQKIHVHDAVSHEEVVPVAKSADVGLCFIQNVSLSDYYCLPNKLFEYAFAEIPVLASNFPDISMVVEKYNLGKCSDLNSESIYNAIKEFELMEELPKINVNDLYDLSWSAQEEKLVDMYKQLIGSIEIEKE